MKWLIGVALVALAGSPANAGDGTTDALELVTPYCAFTYKDGNEAAKCIHDQSMALVRLAALKKIRGADVDGPLRSCVAGQFVDPGSGVNFVDAFKCVSARVSS